MALPRLIAALVSVAMACSRFEAAPDGAGDGAVPPVPTPDGGTLPDGAPGEAAPPPPPPFTCDMFNRATAAEGIWESATGETPPSIALDMLGVTVQSSATAPSLLTSSTRMRGDTLQIRAKVTITAADFASGSFAGRIRVLLLDASADEPAEYAAVSFDKNWLVEYREYPSGMVKSLVGPAVDVGTTSHMIELMAGFHPTAGFVHMRIDGAAAVDMDNLGTQGIIQRTTWRAAVGLEAIGETPYALAAFDDVCISP